MSKFFVIGISFFLFFLSSLQSAEQGYIEWKPIKGAFGYKLEIRDEKKKLIIEEVVNSTRYLIRTPSGKYEFRISPMNVFEKTTVWSYWNPLNVVISKRPSISNTELELDIADLTKPIVFKGKNFLSETKLKFIWGSRVIQAKSITVNDSSSLTAILSPEGAVQGKYELSLENPGNRILSIKNFLTLTDKNDADRLAREKAERERLEAERLAKEKEEVERLAREKAERERLEAERLAREKAERERLEAERLAKMSEKERLEAERLAKEKAERERLDAERLAKEKAERERLEAERLAKEKADRERLERERLSKLSEKERLEAERLAREKAERERLEAERLAKEKAEKERLEAERLAREKAERERSESEKQRLAREKEEQERLAKEKAERERLERERLARERAERERLERERLAREGMKDTRQRVIDGIEDSTNREYLKVGAYELDLILDEFKKSCSPSNLLETLVEKCFSNHTVLKMGTVQKADISNYLLMNSNNYKTRLRSYLYFMRDSTPQMKAALDKLNSKLEKTSTLDIEEREFIQKALAYQKTAK